MRTIHLPLFVESDNPNDRQLLISVMFKAAISRDENLTRGLENIAKGLRLIQKVEAFAKSAVLQLEEDEYAALVSALEKMSWGGTAFFIYPVLKKIKDAPMDEPAEKKKK